MTIEVLGRLAEAVAADGRIIVVETTTPDEFSSRRTLLLGAAIVDYAGHERLMGEDIAIAQVLSRTSDGETTTLELYVHRGKPPRRPPEALAERHADEHGTAWGLRGGSGHDTGAAIVAYFPVGLARRLPRGRAALDGA